MAQREHADRIFMQRRLRGERPDLHTGRHLGGETDR
jgi:hypothetical protein